jgi:tape measure domain-containing protein
MAEREVYRVEIPVEVDDKTEAGLRAPRQRVTAFQRENERLHARMQREQLQRQRAFVQSHRLQTQMERSQVQRMQGRVRLQRDEVTLQRAQVGLQRQQIMLERAQEQQRRASQARSLGGRLRAGAGGVLRGAAGLVGGAIGAAASLPGMLGIAGGIAGGVAWPLKLAADMEQAQVSFTHFLGSEERAVAMLREIQTLANKSPFAFPELRESAEMLLSMQFAADRVLPMLKTLGNAKAAGKDMGGIITALGQISLKGRVQGEELLQLQERGINAAKYLAEGWGISREALMDYVEKGGVPARRAIRHILEGIERDFSGLTEKQSVTLGGLWSTIRDTFQTDILTKWGQGLASGIQPRFERFVGWLDQNKETVDRFGSSLKGMGGGLSDALFGRLEGTIAQIAALTDQHGGSAGGLLAGTWDWIKLRWADFTGWLQDRWNDGVRALTDRVGEFKTDAIKNLVEFKDRALSGLKAMADELAFQVALGLHNMNPLPFKGPAPTRPGPSPSPWRAPGLPAGFPVATAASESAIARGMGQLGSREFIDLCQKWIESLFGTTGQYPTARAAGDALITDKSTLLKDVPRGQLVFFSNYGDTGGAGHVGLALGGGEFLHAGANGVQVSGPGTADYAYWGEHYRGYGAPTFGTASGPAGANPVLAKPPLDKIDRDRLFTNVLPSSGLVVTTGDVHLNVQRMDEQGAQDGAEQFVEQVLAQAAQELEMVGQNIPITR